ncbi:hypothetical protein [Streptomyces sp. NPDC002845]
MSSWNASNLLLDRRGGVDVALRYQLVLESGKFALDGLHTSIHPE